jgi:hypothetical protein
VPINFNVGIFYGQREKWQGDHDSDVLRHPGGRLQRVATFFSVSRALIVDVVLLVILLIGIPAVGWVLFRELRQTAVTVYPVSIPEALSKRGYAPEVVAGRIAAELRRIDREATTMMSRQPITEKRSEIDFQLPGQFLSFRTLVRYTRTLLNVQNTEVNIDITEDKKKYIAQIRVLGGRQSGASKAELSPISADIDAFLAAVGRTTMEVPTICVGYLSNSTL